MTHKPAEPTLPITAQLPVSLAKKLDRWRAGQEDVPTRSKAIRRILTALLEGDDANV